jgi:hypothetical protein
LALYKIPTDINEYNEEAIVEVIIANGRPCIKAYNEGGYNSTIVDLLQVVEWYNSNKDNLNNLEEEYDYIFIGGKYNYHIYSREQVISIGNGKFTEDLSELRAKGVCCHRKELDNQPLVDGYLSPMWDGGKIRYETQDVYDALSR